MSIDAGLVRALIAAQFPQWADLGVAKVEPGGWDNRTFRLGETMSVRLPSAQRYVAQVEKEQAWLPKLAPQLPLPIPAPVALGRPGEGYDWPWSVCRWIEGTPVPAGGGGLDQTRLAVDLAGFLTALQAADAAGGPAAGPHSFHRGGDLAVYDGETRAAIAALGERIDAADVTALWEAGLAAAWAGPPVWVHGDVAAGNLLADGAGRLCAVIDFGCCAVGDPACDLAIAWTLFSGASRAAFRAALPLDEGTWARGRAWCLWKALIVWAGSAGANPDGAGDCSRIVGDLLAEI